MSLHDDVNVILLGQSRVGKTFALLHFRDGAWPHNPYADASEPFSVTLGPSDVVSSRFWDLGGGKEYEELNRLSYPAIDCVILFCKSNETSSYDRANELAYANMFQIVERTDSDFLSDIRGPILNGKPVIIINNEFDGATSSSSLSRLSDLKTATSAAETYSLSIKNDLPKLREAFQHAVRLGREWRVKNRVPQGQDAKGANTTTGAFTIKVIRALLYKAADSNGSADPYVKVGIKRAVMNNWLTKTKVIKKNMNPIWDHCAKIPAGLKSVDGPLELYVELWDEDMLKDDFMGCGTLQVYFNSSGKAVEIKAESVEIKDKKGAKVADLFMSIY